MPKSRHKHPKPPRNLIEMEELSPEHKLRRGAGWQQKHREQVKTYFAINGDYTHTLHPTRGWRRRRMEYSDRPAVALNDVAKWFLALAMKKGIAV